MTKQKTSVRLERLDQLQGLLRARDGWTVSGLAAELSVSVRTLSRDIDLLRERGMPIEADRGRGGGLRLAPNWALGRLHFSPSEAIDMLLSLAIAEQMRSPLLLDHIASIRRKIAVSFPARDLKHIRSLRRRVLVGGPASGNVLETYRPPGKTALTAIATAFFTQRCLMMTYESPTGALTERQIEPQFLHLNFPVWYLLAWDRLRSGIRFFRIDRIREASIMPDGFILANRAEFLAQAEQQIAEL